MNELAQTETIETPPLAVWTTPAVTRLRAGAAENLSGNTVSDQALERIGS